MELKSARAELTDSKQQNSDLKQQITALTQHIATLSQQNTALTASLKAAESLAAASKLQAADSGSGGAEAVRSAASISALQKEVSERPAAEWSAGAVIYWVERVFGAEHKSAQISEFVRELKSCAIGAASEVVGGQRLLSFRVKDFRLRKLTDSETLELITEAIESLKTGGGAKSGAEAVSPNAFVTRCV